MQNRSDYTVFRSIAIAGGAVGVIICTPLPIDEVTKFALFAVLQVKHSAPDTITVLAHWGGALVPLIKISHQKDPIRPNARREFKGDAYTTGDRRRTFVDHKRVLLFQQNDLCESSFYRVQTEGLSTHKG
jgi:hypothetical protein